MVVTTHRVSPHLCLILFQSVHLFLVSSGTVSAGRCRAFACPMSEAVSLELFPSEYANIVATDCRALYATSPLSNVSDFIASLAMGEGGVLSHSERDWSD